MRSSSKLLIIACFALGSIVSANAQQTSPDPDAGIPEMPPPYDCTLASAVLCKAGSSCTPVDKLGELSLPARVLVHFEKQVIASVNQAGLPHVSTITDFSRSGDILVMLGIDGGTGWMMHATANDDEATFVAASDDFVVNAFGSCKRIE
jgi:hypothetical protein